MIDGITILSTKELTEPSIAAFVITVLLIAIAGLVIAVLSDEEIFMVIGICAAIVFGFVALHAEAKPTGKCEYKVTFDDSVSLNQVLEKYEITNQEGLIYTITERENKND